MRRIPSQVPQAVSRLLQGNVLQQPPTWYIPVLSNPPPVLPPRQTVQRIRPANDSIESRDASDMAFIPAGELERRDRLRKFKSRKNKPERIVYLRDKIRRQFFKDFAFEALRPISLVENQEIGESSKIDGEGWTRLEQRGLYPTVEDTIAFVINIQKTRSIPISDAYAIATREFIALRARHEQATIAAEIEARYYGAEFKPDAFERQFNLEDKSLSSLLPPSTRQSSESSKVKYRKLPRWQWSNSLSPSTLGSSNEFTGGEGYMQNWKLPEPPKESILPDSELLSSIPHQGNISSQEDQSRAQQQDQEGEGSEDDLAFLTSVLGKSRT
ncbi:mitochondrial 37S ribosomal protein mS23 [Kwoniella dejecticola CBS 10117]|uniref:Small ribosomal subunit protein mS23 n=1 Tax=Kwoniella dejecticola CBS 10117 TaxID=1296121 RepID=A0A1A6A364_9TREE|nr:uncharacterized protein I303_05356 [Kwoniella dejecticola CBS 10117]OBR84498.1 hypothetical protein I303_05356 [Kwoniella dejecticola CBS 10117]